MNSLLEVVAKTLAGDEAYISGDYEVEATEVLDAVFAYLAQPEVEDEMVFTANAVANASQRHRLRAALAAARNEGI